MTCYHRAWGADGCGGGLEVVFVREWSDVSGQWEAGRAGADQ